jgi:hypothetical protein
VSLLTADAYFSDVPVLSQRKGDLVNEIDVMLNQIGLGVLVMLPKITYQGQVNQVMLGLSFAVFVSEDPTINQTGKPAESVMEKIFKVIHWQANGTGVNRLSNASKFLIDDPAAELVEPIPSHPALLNYLLRFRTIISLP